MEAIVGVAIVSGELMGGLDGCQDGRALLGGEGDDSGVTAGGSGTRSGLPTVGRSAVGALDENGRLLKVDVAVDTARLHVRQHYLQR